MKKLNFLSFIATVAMIVISVGIYGFKPAEKRAVLNASATKTYKIKKMWKKKSTLYFLFDAAGGEVEVSGSSSGNTISALYGFYYIDQIYVGTASGTFSLVNGTVTGSFDATHIDGGTTPCPVSMPQSFNGSYSEEQSSPIAF